MLKQLEIATEAETADSSYSPEMVILKLYDLGIESCQKRDKQNATRIVKELIDALNFDYKDMATTFYDLYRYSLQQIDKEDFDKALEIFQGLRSAWESTVHHGPGPAQIS